MVSLAYDLEIPRNRYETALVEFNTIHQDQLKDGPFQRSYPHTH
jgi:hypothetical protein